jgi:hypothetical protein
MIRLLAHPLSRQQVVSLAQSSCVSPVKLTDVTRGGGGEKGAEETNHTTARKSDPLYIILNSLVNGRVSTGPVWHEVPRVEDDGGEHE